MIHSKLAGMENKTSLKTKREESQDSLLWLFEPGLRGVLRGTQKRMAPRASKGLTLAAVVGSAVAVAVLLVVAGVTQPRHTSADLEAAAEGKGGAVRYFTQHEVRPEARILSKAHTQMLAFSMLGCECQDITNIISADNTWGHYTPKCCSKLKEKTSVASVLGRDIANAQDNTKKLRAALASAKVKLNKQLSVVVDAVTLKNGGRPGKKGPVGKKGPQGYVGAPGKQGVRGPSGVFGPRGLQGHRGQIGYRGDTGDIGNKGVQGWLGSPGAPGYIGPDGPRGATGAEGPPGVDGAKGPPGNQGSLGRTGSTGAMGDRGPPGRVLIFNGYIASTQCEDVGNQQTVYLDRYDVTCQGLLGTSFINQFQFLAKCPQGGNWFKYDSTCINAGNWNKAGDEGSRINCDGYTRFGKGNKWANAKRTRGYVNCDAREFGDPAPGIAKECQCSPINEVGAVSCSTHNDGWSPYGNLEYMDRHNLQCPTNKALTQFKMRFSGISVTYDYTCCAPEWGVTDCHVKYTPCSRGQGSRLNELQRHDVKVCFLILICVHLSLLVVCVSSAHELLDSVALFPGHKSD